MKTYVFRVVADIEEDVFRDIEILGSQNFEDLHDMIIESFDFTGDQMASFYMSDENWDKGEEIGLMDMGFGEEQGPRMMNVTAIEEMVSEKNEKILYLYDFLRMWIFYVEFFEERDFKEGTRYPRCIREAGLSPEETSKEIPDLTEGMFDEEPKKKSQQDEIDDILNEYSDNEFGDESEGEGHENIDDYDF